jgi:hypothetical protein
MNNENDELGGPCELGKPSEASPVSRRSGALEPQPPAIGLAYDIIRALGPQGAAAELFRLGQMVGQGSMGACRGCVRCKRRSVTKIAGTGKTMCILCGKEP